MNMDLIYKSLKELVLLKERIVELNTIGKSKCDIYVENCTKCMNDDIDDIISHLKVFLELYKANNGWKDIVGLDNNEI